MLQQDGARLVGPQVKYHVRLVLENKKYISIEKFLILTVHIRTTFQYSPNLTSPVSSLVEQNQNQTKIHQSSLIKVLFHKHLHYKCTIFCGGTRRLLLHSKMTGSSFRSHAFNSPLGMQCRLVGTGPPAFLAARIWLAAFLRTGLVPPTRRPQY